MDLEKCRALIRVIDTKSMSKAAKVLGCTPSKLSRMISNLEDEMGFTLLRRNRDGMVPTNECRQILDSIRDLLYQERVVDQNISDICGLNTGEIEIGVSHRYYYDIFAQAMGKFNRDYPNVHLKIRHGYSSLLVEELRKHTLDLCIVSKRDLGEGQWIPITKDELKVWLPMGHSLAKEESVAIDAFETENVILTYPGEDTDNQRVFKKYKIHPKRQFSTLDPYASFSMVKQGLGISMDNVLSSWNLGEGVLYKSLRPKEFVEIGIALLENPSPAVLEFMKYLLPLLEKDEKNRKNFAK